MWVPGFRLLTTWVLQLDGLAPKPDLPSQRSHAPDVDVQVSPHPRTSAV